jgi:hypothetical protein
MDNTENTILLLLRACLGITQHQPFFRELLLSNGSICHIVPSLRLFDFFFSEGCACDICDRSDLPPRGLVCTVFTLQLLCCSFLKAAYPKQLPDDVWAVPGFPPSSSSGPSGRCSYISTLLCFQILLLFRRGPTPPQCPDAHFPQSNRSPSYSLCDLQP